MKTKLFLSMAAFIILTLIASAQTTPQAANPAGQGRGQGTARVDANNDGVCDNYENGPRMGQGHGKGKGKGHGARAMGPGQVKGQGHGKGQGYGKGQGRRGGHGPNFVDADKDGICDYRVAQAAK